MGIKKNTHLNLIIPSQCNHNLIILKIKISHNRDYIQTYCRDRRNPFHFACRQWYSYNNPGIIIRILVQILFF